MSLRPATVFMPLSSAHLCVNCSTVHNQSDVCPACASAVSNLTLSSVLDRQPQTREGASVSQPPANQV